MMQRCAQIAIWLCFTMLAAGATRLVAQERQQRPPFRLEQLVQLVESGVFPDERIVFLANQSCLGFRLDDAAEVRLREAGASDQLIASLHGVCVRMLTTVVVRPAEVQLGVGANRILRAEALDQDSARISNAIFLWSSEDTTIAEVSSGGVVLGLAPGEARVTAMIEGGPSGSSLVRVLGPAAEPTEEDSLAFEVAGGKSVGTAAALGVVIPGGGEFYTGNTVKGAVVVAGVAAALTAGFLITNEDTLSVTRSTQLPDCDTPDRCVYQVTTTAAVKETNNLAIGAAVAGAFWLYGLVDGIRSAKRYRPEQPPSEAEDGQSASLELFPRGGAVYRTTGDLDLTLLRVRL
ncbi:MAG: Ig-like domain-containing protein [Gemmatimonadales bacterium]|jgi:hypothetical protein